MSSHVIPVSRSLIACDFHVGYQDGRVDLYGIFNALRPAIYPHVRPQVVVFAQLTGGVGDVPFYFEVRHWGRDEALSRTTVNRVRFPNRTAVVQIAMTIERLRLPEPGLYVIDLFCHDAWVCDTTIHLH